ncbi:hypothetical protein [Pedobacter antarcticus]|uniref:Uncharacterized protein n=2 Tax=Pedobacter antarcticus TaxID=34086 RepID=A0A081PFX1_9SPHI|nr:hypothetical protein [Pedobacter antarcticus]KEQ29594.1 hypothetical protein N180_17285 [Pedobacter antarcticus 4BY]SDM38967.1 hypothetical protein SAMN04488084_106118 [Pedobacter antarcticus]SFE93629.1 hypothetical protein SAMN03003324_01880 [Pedobacter antarcticus]
MKTLLSCLILLLFTGNAYSQKAEINNFLVKEGLLKNSKLAIIAADSLDQPIERINGSYTFTVSGFTQPLKFNEGVAVLPMQLERSAFVYIKHENERGTHSKLLYVYKKDGNLNPIAINSMWLILIPLLLVFIAFAFRKLIIFVVILLLVFMYFNHSNGLNLSTFFETVFDTLKTLF